MGLGAAFFPQQMGKKSKTEIKTRRMRMGELLVAEVRGNRTHRPMVDHETNGFEDRGQHQPTTTSTGDFRRVGTV